MVDQKTDNQNSSSQFLKTDGGKTKSNTIEVPSLSLPKGGGALKGIDEKFSVNAINGTASFSIPLPVSPARGLSPALTLSYNSGGGNGIFGLGWALGLSSIKRKTDRALPKYFDAINSDTYLFSEAEDLVPEYQKEADGSFSKNAHDQYIFKVSSSGDFQIQYYRPRIEGLFARIERWRHAQTGEIKWKVTSKENVTTLFGWTAQARTSDPKDVNRIYEWLPEFVFDDKGNTAHYLYKKEDDSGFDVTLLHNRNRKKEGNLTYTNTYLEKVLYGNKTPYGGFLNAFPQESNYMFQTILDYGEYAMDAPYDKTTVWDFREDAFSGYKAGFEIRTTRLCKRVLLYHFFDELPNGSALVKSLNLEYDNDKEEDFTFLTSISSYGYIKQQDGTYTHKHLPPMTFEYQKHAWHEEVQEIETEDLVHVPTGLAQPYQFTDLFNEGLSGILSEQANGWYYKHNLSNGKFAQAKLVSPKPSFVGLGAQLQLADLDADGTKQISTLSTEPKGFFELNDEEEWQPFKAFEKVPNIDMNNPNTRMIDLNGDGKPDLLISEDNVFVWYESLGRKGFSQAQKVPHSFDEEESAYVVFSDSTQSIFLADMSGDGLTDIVRIRNGDICYWPNLGYGNFGSKISMDHAPRFDHPDAYNPSYIRIADIDGSGTPDIIYLGKNQFSCWMNLSGNRFSQKPFEITAFPQIDNQANITVADILGNGVACIVWSSTLVKDSQQPLRYIDLMQSKKPHVMTSYKNNLGKEVSFSYVPSTKFYIEDKLAGKPWVTKLHFPVHVVEKVTTTDKWNGTIFTSDTSYHHGYYDHVEREFRGFGRVEQIDTQTYGEFAEGNSSSPYITDDHTLYQPPIKTVSWYHTGAMIEKKKILSQFKHEYFPQWLENENTDTINILGNFKEATLPEPAFEQEDLSIEETREAYRACKGMVLRQEAYELDVDALAKGKQKPVKLFSTAYHNCHIQRLQVQGSNPHAVFLVTESEAISYQYELNLQTETLTPDPRISHSFNLNMDELGNVLQAVAVVYPRLGKHQDNSLDSQTIQLIEDVQQETHLAYSESHFTNDIDTPNNYRLRVPCEALSYELTGITPTDEYFTLKELQSFRLNLQSQATGQTVSEIEYQQIADRTVPQKRIIEHSKILYFNDEDSNSAEFLKAPLPFNEQGNLGLPYETYTLALTKNLLDAVLADKHTPLIKDALNDVEKSGYIKGTEIGATADQYWIRSGIAGFADDADEHFFLPERYTDAFNQTTTLHFDPLDLFIKSSTDSIGNSTSVEKFDYRVLAPRELKDINDNVTEMVFDVLGLPTAMALKGKLGQQGTWEGDTLDDFINDESLLNPSQSDVIDFCTSMTQDDAKARQWLGNATTRFIYHFGETLEAQGKEIWGTRMSGACSITREQHKSQTSPLQISLECSDGGGNVLMQKAQAEPDPENGNPRWILNGLTVLNNKGNPVKQYEPAFTHRFGCEMPQANGVTSVIYYDAAGQVIRTEFPDGTISRVSFSPWHVSSYDQNDTVLDTENEWYAKHTAQNASSEFKRAALLSEIHANTPTQIFLDSLGRDVISVEHNKYTNTDGNLQDKKYVTFSKLDAEGKALWIRDARGNLVMQYITPPKANNASDNSMPINSVPCYDIAGNLLFQHSMDGGDRWMINDATGQPFYAWDKNENEAGVLEGRIYHTLYDALRRPTEQQLHINNTLHVIERLVYGENQDSDNNLRGQLFQHYDSSGLVTNQEFDFKGNLLKVEQQLAVFSTNSILHWVENPPQNMLEETYMQNITYDALNRMTRQENWHRTGREPAVYLPTYNERGTLVSEKLIVQGVTTEAIKNIEHDAKGQRRLIKYGNGTTTRYIYDKESFRLLQLRTTKTISSDTLPIAPSNLKDENVLQNLYYTYDPVGNISEMHDDAFKNVFFKNQQVEPRSVYEYDSLYRLIRASGRENFHASNTPKAGKLSEVQKLTFPITNQALRNYTQSYIYDSVGNLKKMIHTANVGSWTRHYKTAEDSNRLLKTWIGNNTTNAINYHYDTHGSMLNLANIAEQYQLQWDSNDMIHHINQGGGGDVFYNYGNDKERSRKRIVRSNDTVEERIYLGGMEVFRKFNATGDIVEDIETYHLFDGEQRILMAEHVFKKGNTDLPEDTTLFKYQYSNHLGSVGLELDEVGVIISYEEYHPYGTTAYSARNQGIKATRKRYKYTGMERDEESGLSYHSARYYLPWLGRWLSGDPIGIEGGVNLFVYVSCNPVGRVDPDGTQDRTTSKIKASNIEYKSPNDTLNDIPPKKWGKLAESRGRKSLDSQVEKNDSFKNVVLKISKEVDLNPGLLTAFLLREISSPKFWLSNGRMNSWATGIESFYGYRKELKKVNPAIFKKIKFKKTGTKKLNKNIVNFKNGESALYAFALLLKKSENDAKKHFGKKWGTLTILHQFVAIRFKFNVGGFKKFSFKNAYDNKMHNVNHDGKPVVAPYGARMAMSVAMQAMHLSQKYYGNNGFPYRIHDIEARIKKSNANTIFEN